MKSSCFAGKVGLITGAGSGIGLAIAQGLAAQGASVVLNDISSEKAELAVAAIRSAGGVCTSFSGDAANYDTIQALIDCALQTYGRLDYCIANAGVTCFGKVRMAVLAIRATRNVILGWMEIRLSRRVKVENGFGCHDL